ncbi:hypothetical protein CH63R_03337 [Colletotrichum higginsianum IMI 349063]|uniref:Uncharacterized protein n=1 Tax=Colletotrichum higginsianum (strain IMI 349063) TaxID=759273 RepID=A0A1B7YRF4_COLHI|nr:hypothetical protein CH63R_03337 [Colletotrichum higginsianum IMI 349063]OBR14611.1 hypothetical protein CH63R_03337 [Colletotrichum higginsianum IMI 349063]
MVRPPPAQREVGGYSGVHNLKLRCKYLLRVSDVPLGRETATININIDNDIDIDTFLPKPPPPQPPPLLFRELLLLLLLLPSRWWFSV